MIVNSASLMDLKRVTVTVTVHKPDLCKLRVRLAAGVTVTVPGLLVTVTVVGPYILLF